VDPTDWLPFYPDQLPKRRALIGPALASQPPYNTEIFPVTDVLAGLTFLPTFPDRVPHTRTTRETTWVTSAAVTATAVHPLVWLGRYPDRVPHRRTPLGAYQFLAAPPPGYLVTVAQRLAWLPKYPDRVPHRRLLPPAGAFWTILPAAAVGTICGVDLAQETFASPALITQALAHPDCLGEGLGAPAFIDEDLC